VNEPITPERVRQAMDQTESVLDDMAYDLAKAYLQLCDFLEADSELRESLVLSLVDVIGHDDWCHGSRCASCPPCTWELNDCSVWTVAERVADAAILFYSNATQPP
jgi:hypothetical protein